MQINSRQCILPLTQFLSTAYGRAFEMFTGVYYGLISVIPVYNTSHSKIFQIHGFVLVNKCCICLFIVDGMSHFVHNKSLVMNTQRGPAMHVYRDYQQCAENDCCCWKQTARTIPKHGDFLARRFNLLSKALFMFTFTSGNILENQQIRALFSGNLISVNNMSKHQKCTQQF